MRVLLASNHRYPAERGEGAGFAVLPNPSGSPQRVHDLIARGLAELGHEVCYLLPGVDAPLPEGVRWVTRPVEDADVLHNLESRERPWIKTQHSAWDPGGPVPPSWVFVSRTLARSRGSDRYVLNGLDPADFIFSETKDDYLLFMAAMQGPTYSWRYFDKGLDVALALAREHRLDLRVAGTARESGVRELVSALCRENGATYLGDVRGSRKAELLAGARALLFPTRLREGCPLVVLEALLSGTPVIAADVGVCGELVTPEVGCLFASRDGFRQALDRLPRISPRACRERAVAAFHSRRMAADYVRQYEIEIGREPQAQLSGAARDVRAVP
jgi:glycosyltransferase involved in cell wall biosynthesis